jgi:hypothetical protein
MVVFKKNNNSSYFMIERLDLDRSVPQPISQEPFAWETRQANELRRERSATEKDMTEETR